MRNPDHTVRTCPQDPSRLSLRRLLYRLLPAIDFTQLRLDVQLSDAEVAEQLRYPHP